MEKVYLALSEIEFDILSYFFVAQYAYCSAIKFHVFLCWFECMLHPFLIRFVSWATKIYFLIKNALMMDTFTQILFFYLLRTVCT